MIRIKRAYEPAARGDGRRILVERLWPRGIKKADLDVDAWIKEVAPSTPLRKWYGHRPERWPEFRRRYRDELSANQRAWEAILEGAKRGNMTLLFSAHDPLRNSAVVLRDYLDRRSAPATRRSPVRRKRTTRTAIVRGRGHRK